MSGRQVWLMDKLRKGGGRGGGEGEGEREGERERGRTIIFSAILSPHFYMCFLEWSESLWDHWEILWILEVKKNQTQSFTICCRAGLMELMLIKCKGTPLRIGFYAFLKAVMIQSHRSCLSICEVLYIWTLDFYTKHLTLSWIL